MKKKISCAIIILLLLPTISAIAFAEENSVPNGWSNDDNVVNLGTYHWPLLNGSGNVTAYKNNSDYENLTHRGTRGLGVAGQEEDEIDAYGRAERIEIAFVKTKFLISFEVRSLFIETYDQSTAYEECDVDLYLNGVNQVHYDLVAEENLGEGNGSVIVSNVRTLVDKIVFYVNHSESYAEYSEFAVAKLEICGNEHISFVKPFSGIDTVNLPPVANAGGPYYSNIGTEIIFNASSSTDDGTIESYEWDFGDGNTSYGKTTVHEYTTYGQYTVTLTVTDDGGLTDSDTTLATISNEDDQNPPSVEITKPKKHRYYKYNILMPRIVLFRTKIVGPIHIKVDAQDNESGVEKVEFYIDGIKRHTDYSKPFSWWWISTHILFERHTIKVIAYDDVGNSKVTKINVVKPGNIRHPLLTIGTVGTGVLILSGLSNDAPKETTPGSEPDHTPKPNQAPVADAGGPYNGITNSEITFDASGSTDDKEIQSYEWSFGDGTTGSGKYPKHSYNQSGEYTVKLTVTDSHGASDSDIALVTIVEEENTPGFGFLIAFCAIAIALFLIRRRT